ncbi:hypothetical protein JCM14469_16110 [Desulfatiferula olefinivorans]
MPIALPDLDDRRYEDLVDELLALIPRYAPGWTDHNASDPGIMLVELFAWLTEALIYRLNRIPEASTASFFRLLSGRLDGRAPDMTGLSFKEAQALTVRDLNERFRAVTADDYASLVLSRPFGDQRAARAVCLPGLDLTADDPFRHRTGHVSVMLVPDEPGPSPVPSPELIAAAADFLDERRLITSRVHVAAPVYVKVAVQAEVVPLSMERREDLGRSVETALAGFFHPLTGGENGKGWPFGRPVYASEVYQVIEAVSGVDYVTGLTLLKSEGGTVEDGGTCLDIGVNGLVDYQAAHPSSRIRIVTAYE